MRLPKPPLLFEDAGGVDCDVIIIWSILSLPDIRTIQEYPKDSDSCDNWHASGNVQPNCFKAGGSDCNVIIKWPISSLPDIRTI